MAKRNVDALAWRELDYSAKWSNLELMHTEKEIRREYSRLRRIANDRLSRFMGTEWEDSRMYEKYAGTFPTLTELNKLPERQQKTAIAHELRRMSQFVAAKTSTTSGLKEARKQAIQTLHDNGYDFINESNYKTFTDYMDEVRANKNAVVVGSPEMLDLFKVVESKNIDPSELQDDFEFWTEHQSELEKQYTPVSTLTEIKDAIENDQKAKTPKKKKGKKKNA